MAFKFIAIIVTIFVVNMAEIEGHGMMTDPVGRGSAWRKGFKTPSNFNDNENFCGGAGRHHGVYQGKCGLCGDPYGAAQPRPHENGGTYGTGTIVRTYNAGSTINVTVLLTASHSGHFEFSLCPLDDKEIETEECFAKYPLSLASGDTKYPVRSRGKNEHHLQLVLPQGLTCKQCSMRWHYRTGNTWGKCPNGGGRVGCGPQETFRSCADISIV